MKFQKTIWDYYKKNKRDLTWRRTTDPYRIFVSEVMLQQTQVARVLKKYPEFLKAFPSFKSLASATLQKVLTVWQGMGYNKRALYLKKSAQIVVDKFKGKLPQDPKILETFPGIGKATANSIVAFAFNKPVVFIETNIRRVFIHFFFPKKDKVGDTELVPFVTKTLDKKNPREWYFALMDYGAMLAKKTENPNRRSKHYSRQTPFVGSNRQIRAVILRQLLNKPLTIDQIIKMTKYPKEDVKRNILAFTKEGLIGEKNKKYFIQ